MGWLKPSPPQLVTVHEHSNHLHLAYRDVHRACPAWRGKKRKQKKKGAEYLPREATALATAGGSGGGKGGGSSSSSPLSYPMCLFEQKQKGRSVKMGKKNLLLPLPHASRGRRRP
ncbi:hypothetical protein D5086_002002 [Populus alba]|uniref:Uncharacterized protein n=1 Tax=Populus alba TaxID=43335 RepID=A0ACC4D093_POPAL